MVKIPPSASLQVCPCPIKGEELKLPSPLVGEGPRERGRLQSGDLTFQVAGTIEVLNSWRSPFGESSEAKMAEEAHRMAICNLKLT